MIKILLVEDDPLMVRMYQRKLVNDGYEALVAVDGEDGLVKVRSFRPDLVLLDIMMPKLNGLQVLERLKSDPTTAKTPVVILTNLGGTQDDIERGLELGAVAYLVKSAYRPDEVIAKVKEVLAGYTHSREIPKTAAESLGGAARVLENTEQQAAAEGSAKAQESKKEADNAEDAGEEKEAPVDGVKAKKAKQSVKAKTSRSVHPTVREAADEESEDEDGSAEEIKKPVVAEVPRPKEPEQKQDKKPEEKPKPKQEQVPSEPKAVAKPEKKKEAAEDGASPNEMIW